SAAVDNAIAANCPSRTGHGRVLMSIFPSLPYSPTNLLINKPATPYITPHLELFESLDNLRFGKIRLERRELGIAFVCLKHITEQHFGTHRQHRLVEPRATDDKHFAFQVELAERVHAGNNLCSLRSLRPSPRHDEVA